MTAPENMTSPQAIDRTMTALSALVVLPLFLLGSGCQSPTVTHEQAQSVLLSRIDVRQQLVATKAQLDASVAALNDINGKQADDLVGAFDKYGVQVDLLQVSIANLQHATAVSKAQGQVYFDTAAAKIALINDAELKSRATSRRQRALGLAQTIDGDTKVLQDAYARFLQRLRDIQAYLAADLTSGCVRSIKDQFAQVNDEVNPTKDKSDRLSSDLELGNEWMNTGDVKISTTTTTTQSASTDTSSTAPSSVPTP